MYGRIPIDFNRAIIKNGVSSSYFLNTPRSEWNSLVETKRHAIVRGGLYHFPPLRPDRFRPVVSAYRVSADFDEAT